MRTYLVVHLDSLDNPLVRLEQGTDELLIVDDLDVSDDSTSSSLGLVEVVLDSRALDYVLMLSV